MCKRREALNIYLQELMRRPAIAETDDFCIFLQLEKEGGVPGVLSAVAAAKGGCGALKVGYVMKKSCAILPCFVRQWKRRYDRRTPMSCSCVCWHGSPLGFTEDSVARIVAQLPQLLLRLIVTVGTIISTYLSRVYRC